MMQEDLSYDPFHEWRLHNLGIYRTRYSNDYRDTTREEIHEKDLAYRARYYTVESC